MRLSTSSSYLPWFEIYYKLLNTLADYLTKQQVIIYPNINFIARDYWMNISCSVCSIHERKKGNTMA